MPSIHPDRVPDASTVHYRRKYQLIVYFVSTAVLSRFDFVWPNQLKGPAVGQETIVSAPIPDSDGDLQVTRKKDVGTREGCVLIGNVMHFCI